MEGALNLFFAGEGSGFLEHMFFSTELLDLVGINIIIYDAFVYISYYILYYNMSIIYR